VLMFATELVHVVKEMEAYVNWTITTAADI
jgi:hypothetical protein